MPLPPDITAALAPGEKVLWEGRPAPHVFMLRGLTAMFYGCVWSILGAFWYHGASLAPWEGWWNIVPTLSLPFIFCGFSFFLYPINLGARARHTWYVVTDQRIFIARLHHKKPVELRVFTRAEMGPPHLIKRFDGLYEIVLARRAQDKPYLIPRLESGFFGIREGEAAEAAIKSVINL
jgi:hypothetical protein